MLKPLELMRKFTSRGPVERREYRHHIFASELHEDHDLSRYLKRDHAIRYYCPKCRKLYHQGDVNHIPGGAACPDCEDITYLKMIVFDD